jgi:hypothetical protein
MNNLRKFTYSQFVDKEESRIDLNYSPGRSRILSQDVERSIISEVQKNPRLSAPKIVSYVSEKFDKKSRVRKIVRRVLRNAQYNGRVAKKETIRQGSKSEKTSKFCFRI